MSSGATAWASNTALLLGMNQLPRRDEESALIGADVVDVCPEYTKLLNRGG